MAHIFLLFVFKLTISYLCNSDRVPREWLLVILLG